MLARATCVCTVRMISSFCAPDMLPKAEEEASILTEDISLNNSKNQMTRERREVLFFGLLFLFLFSSSRELKLNQGCIFCKCLRSTPGLDVFYRKKKHSKDFWMHHKDLFKILFGKVSIFKDVKHSPVRHFCLKIWPLLILGSSRFVSSG